MKMKKKKKSSVNKLMMTKISLIVIRTPILKVRNKERKKRRKYLRRN